MTSRDILKIYNLLKLDTDFRLAHWFSTGGPWPISGRATARKSGRPRTSVYFKNRFACRLRLKNSTGPYEQSYGPANVNYRQNNFFFSEINFPFSLWTGHPRH